jgi:fructosamine-3-kinase
MLSKHSKENRTVERYFVKTARNAALLDAEAEGLHAIAATKTVRVPRVIDLRPDALVLERLDFRSPDAAFGERFGAALAALHLHPCGHTFGWPRDNFIGATPQVNTLGDDWIAFWRDARLRPMVKRLAPRERNLRDAALRVMAALPSFFDDDYVPRPSLVHGDLWSGNWGMLADGTPVIFDPCVSYSDREAELAMMELFGAPPAGFWPAYESAAGLAPGYPKRRPVYQLYHLLNHAVLFGGTYAQQALACARGCLAARPGPASG